MAISLNWQITCPNYSSYDTVEDMPFGHVFGLADYLCKLRFKRYSGRYDLWPCLWTGRLLAQTTVHKI